MNLDLIYTKFKFKVNEIINLIFLEYKIYF
jgi:hypothetical protein